MTYSWGSAAPGTGCSAPIINSGAIVKNNAYAGLRRIAESFSSRVTIKNAEPETASRMSLPREFITYILHDPATEQNPFTRGWRWLLGTTTLLDRLPSLWF
jgi:hypothetical protein